MNSGVGRVARSGERKTPVVEEIFLSEMEGRPRGDRILSGVFIWSGVMDGDGWRGCGESRGWGVELVVKLIKTGFLIKTRLFLR